MLNVKLRSNKVLANLHQRLQKHSPAMILGEAQGARGMFKVRACRCGAYFYVESMGLGDLGQRYGFKRSAPSTGFRRECMLLMDKVGLREEFLRYIELTNGPHELASWGNVEIP